MGQAKRRGTYEVRKEQAIAQGKVKTERDYAEVLSEEPAITLQRAYYVKPTCAVQTNQNEVGALVDPTIPVQSVADATPVNID